MLIEEDLDEYHSGLRLQLIASPIVQRPRSTKLGTGADDDDDERRYHAPDFAKRHGASYPELFYDLWFVANLNVFQAVSSRPPLFPRAVVSAN
jgi:hypothetical protein